MRWEGRVRMCHISISDYSPIPRDCYEFSLINDPESDATFLHYPSLPSPTLSMVLSLHYDFCRLTTATHRSSLTHLLEARGQSLFIGILHVH